MTYIFSSKAEDFIPTLSDNSVKLLLIDPPFRVLTEREQKALAKDNNTNLWDNQWPTEQAYVDWLVNLLVEIKPKLTTDASIVMFHCLGKHNDHPIFSIVNKLEQHYQFRNWITWKKRRAYGKEKDYLYCREEILWFSVSKERTEVVFNIPLLKEKRGYAGFSAKYPAKSEFKRVSNVWGDIPELMRPKRTAQKPEELLNRLIETHSNPDDLVVDIFCGYGSAGISAIKLGRKFKGCEAIEEDAIAGNQRCIDAVLAK